MAVLCVGRCFAEATPDESVRALVKETRELLAVEKLDEAVEKVREAVAVEGASLRAQGTVYNVYADVMRKRGDAVTADKSLLKAYDCLRKAREAAKDEAERKSLSKASAVVAERLSATKDGAALLEDYRTKKSAKKREQEAAARRESAAARKTSSAKGSGAANAWNPWKKGVVARRFDAKAKRDGEMPWTPDEAAKLLGKPAGRGVGFLSEVYEALSKKYGRRRALDWYEYVLEKPTKFDLSKSDLPKAWNDYGFRAQQSLDHSRILQTMVGLKKCGGKPEGYFSYRAEPSIRMFEDLKTFPRDPATIVFPKENIWVKGKRTVRAKDYGWNATDATVCLQKALDDPKGDIVIVDKMEGPWLLTGVKVPSNKTVVFEKGVRVHATASEQASNSRTALIALAGGTDNQALIGKGDVVIGKFPNAETRNRFLKEEGGTGIYLEGARNVLIRDLTVSECGCDGITLGGCHRMNGEIYIENVVLDHNARQAVSMCNGCGVYMKNVKFLNTCGAQPMAGIDFEPSIQEVEATCNIYLIDCAFDNNAGGNIVFSESSTYPVTVLFKNCDIGSHDYGAVRINALCGLYQGNGTDAPSDIVFDGCTVKGVSWCPPVTIQNANLFHVSFRNCDIVEVAGKPIGVTPFRFELNREYYNARSGNRTWYQKEGSLSFENTRVKGWKGSETLSFDDRTGHYSVRNIFGRLLMNGKNVDMTKCRYEAPDFKFAEVPEADPQKLSVSSAAVKGGEAGSVVVSERAPWWVGEAHYAVYSPNGAGGYGVETVAGKEVAGRLSSSRGASIATRCTDGLFRISSPSTVYFEVPAGKGEVMAKIVKDELFGQAELLKGREKVAATYSKKDLGRGYVYVPLKQSQKPQLYGFRVTSGTLVFKLFAPCSGLVSPDPGAILSAL